MSGQQSAVDWLTGLPSMMRFHELAREEAAALRQRGEQPVAVALDLVGMKSFNTQYGREEGDVLLCLFADEISKRFGHDACSRFAEDHFYAYAQIDGLESHLDDLFSAFRKANEGRVLPIRVGAYVCNPEDDIVVGFDRAKIACDHDRKTWESHIMWFTEEMHAQARLRIHVLENVEKAIAEGWVRPYYQAIVRSSTGHVCGEEALARWVDPKYGELAPDKFIPVLEDSGVLQKLDMHIVDCVLADISEKRKNGVPVVPVSVNISLRDIGRLNVAAEVARKVDAVGIAHNLLRIEFTESAASDDPERFRTQVQALRDNGFEVWMDDFGSGYSSLNTLQEFAFDLIKLDMAFIRGIHNEKANDIMAGIVQISKKLGMGTLAEGVEFEDQALFLEGIGCDMMQGFFFSNPLPLDVVSDHALTGLGIEREDPAEAEYWDAVGSIDLIDPVANADKRTVDGALVAEYPAGVMEKRKGVWSVLRANKSFRDFLDRGGILPKSRSNLQAHPVEAELDESFILAVKRCSSSGAWERIASHLEYGLGLQFYVKPIAASQDAEAFAIASIPTNLGTALGTYGDVPVAYAVFRAVLSEAGDEVVDAEYVYVNSAYCEWGGYEEKSLIGRSYLETSGKADRSWFPYCYRAAVLGESIHDTVYSAGIGRWMNFSIAPSPVEGCCVFAFTIADDEQRELEDLIVGRDTSDLIIRVANTFNSNAGYHEVMNSVLDMISRVIHPKRLFIFERGGELDWVTFEWCADGVESQIGTAVDVAASDFGTWDKLAEDGQLIYFPNTFELEQIDRGLYERLTRHGITHMMAVPLRDGDSLIGYLVAENYVSNQGIDVRRLLETVASFIGSRIVNYRLVVELERAGTHDVLTGLLNRRGFDNAISERMEAEPDAPYVLALMDIDDFKLVNDLHGHEFGDEVLRVLSRAVRQAVPENAVIGRNGGDELVTMLFGEDALLADEVFERFSQSQLGCEHEGKWHRLSMSIGYAGYPDQAADLKEAYTKADAALYAVKLAGKAGCKRYSPEVEVQYRSQLGFTPRDIAENVPGAILVHRAGGDGDILFANDELVEMFECDSLSDFIEFTGGTFARIVHPDDAVRVYDELVGQVALDEIGAKNFSNYRIITKKGNVKHVADNGRLVEVDEVGKVFYVLLIDRDERDVC